MIALGFFIENNFDFLAGQMCNVGGIINNTGIINFFGEGNTMSQLEGK